MLDQRVPVFFCWDEMTGNRARRCLRRPLSLGLEVKSCSAQMIGGNDVSQCQLLVLSAHQKGGGRESKVWAGKLGCGAGYSPGPT